MLEDMLGAPKSMLKATPDGFLPFFWLEELTSVSATKPDACVLSDDSKSDDWPSFIIITNEVSETNPEPK